MTYNVDLNYVPEAEVWIATNDEITGLVLEDDSYDRLVVRVQEGAPELLELNG